MTLKVQETIQSLTTQYGNDPEVMARLQQMLMSYGLIGPDGRLALAHRHPHKNPREQLVAVSGHPTKANNLLVKTVEAAEANFGFQEWIDP